ncbi:hypothetical protein SLA2020_007650 [Shorea laevis]
MMHMTFYWSLEVTLLFSSWKTHSWLSYALTLIACIAASACYQYVEHIRYRLRQVGKPTQLDVPLLPDQKARWSVAKIAGGVAFGFSSGLGYLLMLAVMSFNGGVFLAIVLGLTIGYLSFRTEDDEGTTGGVGSTCACA